MATFLQPELTLEQIIGIATRPASKAEIKIAEYKQFYSGTQNVKHSDRQNLYLGEVNTTFPDAFVNVTELVVNVLLDRLAIMPDGQGVMPLNDESRDYAQQVSDWWVWYGLNSIQNEIHEYLLRDGSAAMFVSWSGGGYPVFTAEQIYDGYSGVRFKQADWDDDITEWASKVWYVSEYNDDGTVKETYQRLNIYLPGALYRYYTTLTTGVTPQSYIPLSDEQVFNETGGLISANPQPIPIASLPIIKFQNNPERSEIDQVFKLQKLITKAASDIDIVADQHAAPLLAAEEGLNQDLLYGPGMGLNAKGVKRIEPSNLELMWDGSLLKWIDMISLVKRWPLYLLNPRDFSVPSGKALDALERSLVNQIFKKQNDLDIAWQQTFSVAREWSNALAPGPAIDTEAQIRFDWQPPNTENATEDREIQVRTAKEAGLPDVTIWEQVYGMTQEQIAETLTARQGSLAYKMQIAELIEKFSRGFVPLNQAVEFIDDLITDDEALQLTEVNIGSGNTSFSERLATAGNGRQNPDQPER